jgi:hypothetical protein
MKFILRTVVLMFILSAVSYAEEPLPKVYLVKPASLAKVKASFAAGEKTYLPALKKLERDAEKALRFKPVSVMEKEQIPPSGNKHDYMSLSKYWWPDPDKSDGLPYIRKDGEVNPETNKIPDHENLNKVILAVSTLGQAYYFNGEEKYAEKATAVLRFWFLDPESRMNPNLNYAQAVPGRSDGRGTGIIDAHQMPYLIDAMGLLEGSKSWTTEIHSGMKQWFTEYFRWLRESKNGKDEAKAKNNHGTWYDVQTVSIALFIGEKDYAVQCVREAKEKRIARQIEPDGRQPQELERTRGLGYSIFNLMAMCALAQQAETVGENLWQYQTADGRSIRKALDWVIPYALEGKEWPYKQIKPVKAKDIYHLLLFAAYGYNDRSYREKALTLPDIDFKTDRTLLYFPE